MKNTWLLLLLILLWIGPATAQSSYESAAQRVTNHYIQMLSLSASEAAAIKLAVQQLEEKGLYSKIHALYIGRHFSGEHLLNVMNPSPLDGALRISADAGEPEVADGGLLIKSDVSLNTHFVNDEAAGAPLLSLFWITDENVNVNLSSGTSPFDVASRYDDGKCYISIWASATGLEVPPAPAGFSLIQRSDDETVALYRTDSTFTENLPITSRNPMGGELVIKGDRNKEYSLKLFGIADSFTPTEVQVLRAILEQLNENLF